MRITTIIVATMLLTGTAAQALAQQSERERRAEVSKVVTDAAVTAFVLGQKNPNYYNHAYVVYTGDSDTGLDALVEQRELLMGTHWVKFGTSYNFIGNEGIGYVPAGIYVLKVPRNGSIADVTEGSSGRSTEFDIDTMAVNFVRGRHYAIDSRVDDDNRVTFTIGETQPEHFSAFQRANPGLLEGTWSGETKNIQASFTLRYTISGDRITFEGTRNRNQITAEGRLAYTENAIIMYPERAVGKGKEIRYFAELAPYIWRYTLDGDVLLLESRTLLSSNTYARPFQMGGTLWINDGELRRTE